jgi:hypothetical protein
MHIYLRIYTHIYIHIHIHINTHIHIHVHYVCVCVCVCVYIYIHTCTRIGTVPGYRDRRMYRKFIQNLKKNTFIHVHVPEFGTVRQEDETQAIHEILLCVRLSV